MHALFLGQFLLFSVAAVLSSPTPVAPAPALPTICGDIVNSCNDTFTAKQAYDCLVSVPFNAAVASNLVKYVNDTIQFQSTLAYLKNPPASYQQPAVDILGGLQRIQQDIDRGAFNNQYSFEITLQSLIYAAHDAHLSLEAGILAAFTWHSPYSFVTLSEDGVQEPKVYILDDVYLSQPDFQPSAIKTINGQDTTDFLTHLAAQNSFGNLEPHTDWNALMSSWATYIQDEYSVLENYITFYPGEDLTITFENGTQLDPQPWMATYFSQGPTGPLANGGDFYNFFVLGLYPASFDFNAPSPCASVDGTDNSTSTNSAVTTTATSWPDSAYPETADIFQPDLYPFGSGFITGYFLREISTAVLSIPTFQMSHNDTLTFSATVANFLEASHKAGMQKVLIDVQQNLGGEVLLAVDTFMKFFPTKDTFRGTRFRAHPSADVLGTTLTRYFQDTEGLNSTFYNALASNIWVATDRLNAATDQNFTSWAASFGPHEYNGDFFSAVERDNISSTILDRAELGEKIKGTIPELYRPEDIAILTDGQCASTCAVFVEMMHHGAGIRTVVAGGLPHSGPMQASGGTRGYQVYNAEKLDSDIAAVELLNKTAESLLPDRQVQTLILSFGINLRDQIRQNDSTPVQFLYDAADCRIYYTAESWNNYTTLWTHASKAVFSDNSLCVPGSTGHAIPGGAETSAPAQNYNPTANDSSYVYSPDKFTNSSDNNVVEGTFHPEPQGQRPRRAKPIPCNNYGNPCIVGECIPTEYQGRHTDQLGRMKIWYIGTCSQDTVSPPKSPYDYLTGPDQPPEVNADASPDGSDE